MSKKGKIGIVGSGFVGSSWAMIFASVGYEVKMYDVDEKQVSSAMENILAQLEMLYSKGLLRGKLTPAQQFSLIKGVTSLEACVADALYIQESVFEDLDLKIKVFKELDQIVLPNTIIASSTSCIVPSKFTANLKNKANCIVAHPVNPPYLVPLVEIVPAPWTSADTLEKARNFLEDAGQSPIVFAKEIDGFGINRLQYVLLNECYHLTNDGILSVADVDKIMKDGLAYRYLWTGPLETAYLNAAKGFEDYIERYASSVERVSSSYKDPPKWNIDNWKFIAEDFENRIPLEHVKERRKWRDERLAAVAKLKKKMTNEESRS